MEIDFEYTYEYIIGVAPSNVDFPHLSSMSLKDV